MASNYDRLPSFRKGLEISERWIHTSEKGEVTNTKGSKKEQCISLGNHSEASIKSYKKQDEELWLSLEQTFKKDERVLVNMILEDKANDIKGEVKDYITFSQLLI